MVSLTTMIVQSQGKVVALPEEYDLMSHVSGVYSDDGASTFIENMLKEEPKLPKRRMKRSHSTSNVPEELLIMAPQEKSEESLNDLSAAVKPKRKSSSRKSKNEKSKHKKKKPSSSEQASAPTSPRRKYHGNISVVRDKEAPSTPESGFNTVLAPTSPSHRSPSHRSLRFSLPALAHSPVRPHTPPRRLASSPRRRSTIQISRTSMSGRRVSPSPGRSASPGEQRRRSSTRRRLSRSRSPSNSRSISPSSIGEKGGGSASENSSYGSHQSTRRRTSRTRTNSRSISPSTSWDRSSASGASGSSSRGSSYGSMPSGSRRRRSRSSYPSAPVRERTLSPGSLRRHNQAPRLSHHLNDNKKTDNHEKVPFRRLSPRSSQSIRRKSGSDVNSIPHIRQHRRQSDPVVTRALRLRSKSPSSRWNSTACKSPPSICRRRPDSSKSPSSSRRRLPSAIASNQQLILQLTKEDWDGEDSVIWKKPSKASIMDDESLWTRP
jgi:hypothetical protein